MGNETSKSWHLRTRLGDFQKYLHGNGIDIGCGGDLLKTTSGEVTGWDLDRGDAVYMVGIDDNFYDFAYSSHCLEHVDNVEVALSNWIRIVKPFGYIYFTIPDYRLYEKNSWPSPYNGAHKFSFSLHFTRQEVGRDNHYHIFHDILPAVQDKAVVIEVRLEDENFDYHLPNNIDQTRGNALCQICIILQKCI